jgi:hypothetical protein
VRDSWFLIADADLGLVLMLTYPGDIFRWWIRKVSTCVGPTIEGKADLSSTSSHYIGYIPLELYQTALQSGSHDDPKGVAGRFLIDQTQA